MLLVTLRSYRDPIDAHVHKASLEAAGIPAFIADDNLIGVQWLYSTAVGGAKLKVLSSDVAAAAEVLEADSSSELAAIPEARDSAGDGDACPVCGSSQVESSSLFRRSLAVSLILELPLFLWRRRWVCGACGYSWRHHARSSMTRPETAEAELLVRGPRGSHRLTLMLLLSWVGLCIIYYVLRQPTETW
jgi:transposase-like protein